MSRIQDILDKAEREGLVGHTFSAVTAPPEPHGHHQIKPLIPVTVPADLDDLPGHRTVSGARLDRLLVAAVAPGAVAAEQYRALRTRILRADTGALLNVLLVTSPGRREGKTVTAANLALAMAQEPDRRVCLVDADMRSPQLKRLFGLPEGPGLADVISRGASLDDALVTLEDHAITVLPAGMIPARPAELLGGTGMRRLLETLRSQFDMVIIDGPAATPLADIGILTPLVDCVLLIVRIGVTSKPAIHEAIAGLDAAKLLGVVLNEAA